MSTKTAQKGNQVLKNALRAGVATTTFAVAAMMAGCSQSSGSSQQVARDSPSAQASQEEVRGVIVINESNYMSIFSSLKLMVADDNKCEVAYRLEQPARMMDPKLDPGIKEPFVKPIVEGKVIGVISTQPGQDWQHRKVITYMFDLKRGPLVQKFSRWQEVQEGKLERSVIDTCTGYINNKVKEKNGDLVNGQVLADAN